MEKVSSGDKEAGELLQCCCCTSGRRDYESADPEVIEI
jgi:hypothetical protein